MSGSTDPSGDISSTGFPTGIDLGRPALSGLLRIGLSAPPRPVDRLIERVARRDGEQWLAAVLGEGAPRQRESVRVLLLEGEAALDAIREMKSDGKRRYREAPSEDERLAGLLRYALCLAAALAHHGEHISGRPRHDVNEMLIDLAETMPPAWRDFLERAALR